jgi:hypothetical protein
MSLKFTVIYLSLVRVNRTLGIGDVGTFRGLCSGFRWWWVCLWGWVVGLESSLLFLRRSGRAYPGFLLNVFPSAFNSNSDDFSMALASSLTGSLHPKLLKPITVWQHIYRNEPLHSISLYVLGICNQ